MSFSDFVTGSLERPIAAIRRYAISLAVAGAAAVGALVYAASALVLALEVKLGPVGARGAVAAVLLVVAIAGYLLPRFIRPAPAPSAAAASPDLEALSRDQRLAMVIEALMLGFSMGSRKPADGDK